ncbi:hypothetical protein EXIGLDRAFT_838564 [Exidia glandulosa HHB12029]|uniref:Uncharacterized protein n=1 Tax=Exidia glandulosa HHB12029 TaxID=1314781 RepID=A0A165FQP1_EXIGL|nr:hypothetical protein EXIGLDRAFT_838564 [Exidia glandulosa HHB12029]
MPAPPPAIYPTLQGALSVLERAYGALLESDLSPTRLTIRKCVDSAGLDEQLTLAKQDRVKLGQVCLAARERQPYLKRFQSDWATRCYSRIVMRATGAVLRAWPTRRLAARACALAIWPPATARTATRAAAAAMTRTISNAFRKEFL